jgi:hypothetical protein
LLKKSSRDGVLQRRTLLEDSILYYSQGKMLEGKNNGINNTAPTDSKVQTTLSASQAMHRHHFYRIYSSAVSTYRSNRRLMHSLGFERTYFFPSKAYWTQRESVLHV